MTHRGSTRVTRTNTSGMFFDRLTFNYDPMRHREFAALGDELRELMEMPPLAEIIELSNQDGQVMLHISCNYIWNAGPEDGKEGFDAVVLAAVMFVNLYHLLNSSGSVVDMGAGPAPRPALPPSTSPAYPRLLRIPVYFIMVGALYVVGVDGLKSLTYYRSGQETLKQHKKELRDARKDYKRAKRGKKPPLKKCNTSYYTCHGCERKDYKPSDYEVSDGKKVYEAGGKYYLCPSVSGYKDIWKSKKESLKMDRKHQSSTTDLAIPWCGSGALFGFGGFLWLLSVFVRRRADKKFRESSD